MKRYLKSTFLILVLVLSSCSQREKRDVADTIVDDYGRTVLLHRSPTRIVSASPSITEIVCALGGQALLVGRTDFCTFPPSVESIASIGGISNLNIEAILARKPDLVLCGSMIPQKSVDQLERMGVPVVCVIEKPRFDGLYENISKIGHITGLDHAADSLNRLIKEKANTMSLDQSDSVARPTVYYVVGYGATGNFTAGGNTFIDDIIVFAGGKNLAHDISGWSYSVEALMQQNPDYIVVRREDSADFCRTNPYSRLDAVRKHHVIGIESSTLDIQVPRNIDAIDYLRKKIRP